MYLREDAWMMKAIFRLSDRALIRMVNRLFQTEYEDEECVRKEWNEHEVISVWLIIGCANRYEFQIRRFDGCLQIYAEDRGCAFHYADALEHTVVQIREPHMIYFGKNSYDYVSRFFRTKIRRSRSYIVPAFFILLFCRGDRETGEEAGVAGTVCAP